jgi:SPP1 family predicted phage head-tail adaptor
MNSEIIVNLISKATITKNEIGEAIYTEKSNQIFAKKKSVKQSEYFQAAAAGFKPEIVIEIYSFEYNNEEICEMEGKRFKIYRSYPISGTDRLELYLTDIVGESNVTA